MSTIIDASAETLASALNIPSGYVFLLFGLVLGLALGWIIGRQQPKAAAMPFADVGRHHLVETPEASPTAVSLVINGNTVNVAPDVMVEIQGMIVGGQKIEAIKRLRLATGLNLAAAKSVVESLEKVIG